MVPLRPVNIGADAASRTSVVSPASLSCCSASWPHALLMRSTSPGDGLGYSEGLSAHVLILPATRGRRLWHPAGRLVDGPGLVVPHHLFSVRSLRTYDEDVRAHPGNAASCFNDRGGRSAVRRSSTAPFLGEAIRRWPAFLRPTSAAAPPDRAADRRFAPRRVTA